MSSFKPYKQDTGYAWNYTYVNPFNDPARALAMSDSLRVPDSPSTAWALKVAERLAAVVGNAVAIEASKAEAAEIQGMAKALGKHVESGKVDLNLIGFVIDAVVSNGRPTESARPSSIDDYAALFQLLALPPIAGDYNQDAAFAAMRLAGPNPVMIARVDSRGALAMPLTDAQYQTVMSGDSIDAAIGDHRLFQCDYSALKILNECVADQPTAKYLYAPVAVFAVHSDTNALVPVAIRPGPIGPNASSRADDVFLADGSCDWLIAKTIVEMADGNIHETVSHLGRTHLFVEPFIVSMFKNFPTGHAVANLLWPHFEGTVFINYSATQTLIAPGGQVDQLLQGPLNCTLRLTVSGVQDFGFDANLLPTQMGARGVDKLPGYSYRDDAMLYWKSIHSWVTNYLAASDYAEDAKVAGDVPIQAWYRESVAHDGGRVPDMGPIQTVSRLADVLTMIIFTSSVQHAAVNFPQFDLMSYCPNMPFACYAQFPLFDGSKADPQQALDMLPPMDRAKLQLQVGATLGGVHYTQLGVYDPDAFSPEINSGPLKQFAADLESNANEIRKANINRRPYHTLMPDLIPQSINI